MENNNDKHEPKKPETNKPYIGKKTDKFGNIYEGSLLNDKAEGHGIIRMVENSKENLKMI